MKIKCTDQATATEVRAVLLTHLGVASAPSGATSRRSDASGVLVNQAIDSNKEPAIRRDNLEQVVGTTIRGRYVTAAPLASAGPVALPSDALSATLKLSPTQSTAPSW